jgi:flagellar hook-associated protein 1
MGITNLFDVASSGITAQRLAIEVAGENIANVNTEGYSRQQVVLTNKSVITSNGFPLGTGVQVQTVQRSYDAMLQLQIQNGNSNYQQSLARQTALDQIQPSFNELAGDGLGTALTNYFDSWQDLSTNPQGTAERQALMATTQVLTDTFHQMSQSLSGIATTADNKLVGLTADVSTYARNLAQVNTEILATSATGGNPNELFDQRDLLIQKISEKAGITASLKSDGTAVVSLMGTQSLVDGTKYATLYTASNGGTPPKNDILVTAIGNPPPAQVPASDTKVTGSIGGTNNSLGEIGGTLLVRDTIVPGYLSKLDEMASNLVTSVNTQHALGYGIDGPPSTNGHDFFDAASTTAATIKLDTNLTLVRISAGLPTGSDPAPTSSGNNGNAVQLASLKNVAQAFTSGSATFASYYNTLVSTVGIDTQAAQNTTTQGAAFLKQLNNLRQSNSGVSLDEELTNLTKYQQAFQGSAKVLNAATEMMDIVLGMLR